VPAPLTPEQVARLVEAYGQTGNYAAAGKVIGVERNTARDAIRRVTTARRRTLHARACESALRRVRKHLSRTGDRIEAMLGMSRGETALEPKDFAQLSNALSKISDTLANIADREDRRVAGRLTRDKTRVEIARLRAGEDAETGDVNVTVNITGPDKVPEASGR
jgi:hypothetical protein